MKQSRMRSPSSHPSAVIMISDDPLAARDWPSSAHSYARLSRIFHALVTALCKNAIPVTRASIIIRIHRRPDRAESSRRANERAKRAAETERDYGSSRSPERSRQTSARRRLVLERPRARGVEMRSSRFCIRH